uniref:Uncharacterized protein n=1 Tax=Hyaloperonospora arabidopsidis (strain Emoy2) TaxID=559515 RepID=M4BZY8_HYAAE
MDTATVAPVGISLGSGIFVTYHGRCGSGYSSLLSGRQGGDLASSRRTPALDVSMAPGLDTTLYAEYLEHDIITPQLN